MPLFMQEQDHCGGSHSDKVDLDWLDNDGTGEDKPLTFDLAQFVDSISLLVESAVKVPVWSIYIEY